MQIRISVTWRIYRQLDTVDDIIKMLKCRVYLRLCGLELVTDLFIHEPLIYES